MQNYSSHAVRASSLRYSGEEVAQTVGMLGRRGVLECSAVCEAVKLFFLCCREENSSQRLSVSLLTEVCRPSEVPTIVSTDLPALSKDFGHLYYVLCHSYWA